VSCFFFLTHSVFVCDSGLVATFLTVLCVCVYVCVFDSWIVSSNVVFIIEPLQYSSVGLHVIRYSGW